MAINYKLWKVTIHGFRGIDHLELEFGDGVPNTIIGANNAGKSTILNAIALALNGGGFHQWSPSETDFYCDEAGNRAPEFTVQVLFHSSDALGYPAVKGVGQASLIHGVQVKGKINKDGRTKHSRTLLDKLGRSVTLSTRTSMKDTDKLKFAEHNIGYRPVNARLDDISDHTPEVWLFKPQNIEASLYIWKTVPIAKLSKLLAERFLGDSWTLPRPTGDRKMPETLHQAHAFFREAVESFPFWTDDMKPRLERVFSRYVGSHATVDLRPDTQVLEEWLAQQLAVSLATDPQSSTTPLRNMGDGWQSMIRLAALEALSEYPDLVKDRVVLLVEEPETHLHPHLCRKIRRVLSDLAAKGWTVVYTTHSSNLVSFEARQKITRIVRLQGKIVSKTVDTATIDHNAKLQSKLDEQAAHDFLFGTGAIFCEGKDDSFAVRLALEKAGVDCDARSLSVTQCGSVTAIPAFCAISSALGIRWCALTDEDRLDDGSINPSTKKHRKVIENSKGPTDTLVEWPGNLEKALGMTKGKATPEMATAKLNDTEWKATYPDFARTIGCLAAWIDPSIASKSDQPN